MSCLKIVRFHQSFFVHTIRIETSLGASHVYYHHGVKLDSITDSFKQNSDFEIIKSEICISLFEECRGRGSLMRLSSSRTSRLDPVEVPPSQLNDHGIV